jgi:3-dehydroquinate dehydratase
LNRYLKTPKITYESIIMDFHQQQQQQIQSQHEAQKKAAEAEAMERAKRMYAEQQRQFARLDGQGNQPRRF